MAPAPSLLSLPTELLVQILTYLDHPTFQILAGTHERFQSLIDFVKARETTPPSEIREQLIHASFAHPYYRFRRMLACNLCLCLRYRWEFCDGVVDYWNPRERFCNECGVLYGKSPPGMVSGGGEDVLAGLP
ncbi:MAG: hypothetical protein FRX48_09648 [Lasallia pustulata]|uniref:F-box domain-containing protein n=1 Tax=Lasallia pustulata TaxID=136370 RepID=A0A5M8PC00_9LECA|nr:MAG: hypothetical protein FRX48_09648 [Lasallia pustulata]